MRTYKHLFMVEDYIDKEGKQKGKWTKVGVAFENKDGSFALQMAAMPTNGRLVLREPFEDRPSEGEPAKVALAAV